MALSGATATAASLSSSRRARRPARRRRGGWQTDARQRGQRRGRVTRSLGEQLASSPAISRRRANTSSTYCGLIVTNSSSLTHIDARISIDEQMTPHLLADESFTTGSPQLSDSASRTSGVGKKSLGDHHLASSKKSFQFDPFIVGTAARRHERVGDHAVVHCVAGGIPWGSRRASEHRWRRASMHSARRAAATRPRAATARSWEGRRGPRRRRCRPRGRPPGRCRRSRAIRS